MRKPLIYIFIALAVIIIGYFVFASVLKDNAASVSLTPNVNSVKATDTQTAVSTPKIAAVVNSAMNINLPLVDNNKNLNKFVLFVPYVSESPDNIWTGPWKNACEEASITMVEKYYLGKNSISISEAKSFMTMLFQKENILWDSNANSDAARTAQLINDYTIYYAKIIDNPTLDEIKNELVQGRPVITPLYGFGLHNKNIPFVPPPRGSSYHMLVIEGYDDNANEFITDDPGDTIAGASHRYSYNILMGALHDYNYADKRADGPATAIFTYPRLVKLADSPKVYYLQDGVKQWIVDEATFNAKGWSWAAVNVVDKEWLDNFKIGVDIKL